MKSNLFESDFQDVWILHQVAVTKEIDQLHFRATVSAGEHQRECVGQADGGVEEVRVLGTGRMVEFEKVQPGEAIAVIAVIAVIVTGLVVGLEKVQRKIVQGDLQVIQTDVHLAHCPG